MDRNLLTEFIETMFKIRKMNMNFANDLKINMVEIMILNIIDSHTVKTNITCISEIKNSLFITKSAISQLLNSLEKNGYIDRKTNKQDKRKMEINLTARGKETLKFSKDIALEITNHIIERFGEKDMEIFLHFFNRFADINQEVKNDYLKKYNNDKMEETKQCQ